VSEEKFSKCVEEKKCKCRISGVRKKNGNWKKSSGKKIEVFFLDENLKWKILLSSCPLVGLYVNSQGKVTEKFDENFQSIFRVGLKLKLWFAGKGSVKITCWKQNDCECRARA